MKCIAVLQARTNSTRLPGKVMLPVNGMPMVVLAAKRAANTGIDVIVATSSSSSDDGLASLIISYGLRCFRGSLENTLTRFVDALSEYNDETIVFRLTADNVFPDGRLLEEMLHDYLDRDLHYLCSTGEPSGLPYGVSAEVTKLKYLRDAATNATSPYDQEHVTPYIIKNFGYAYFQKYSRLNKSHYRCTVDNLDDYIVIQSVFADVDDPVQESTISLIKKLETVPFQPHGKCPTPKFVLGAAQLGSNYGIANTTGQPDKKQCQELIKTAVSNGVVYIDTARVYGSEEVIGQSLKGGWERRVKIITKLSPLEDCPENVVKASLSAFVDASVYKSCSMLQLQCLDVLMLHRASNLSDWDGGVWKRLLELKHSGVIHELGASVQTPDELSKVLLNPEITYIQLPLNIMDWRWDSKLSEIIAAKASRKLTIHVRSVLLQGLLPSLNERHWEKANVLESNHIRDWLLNQVDICNRLNVIDLCINYVNAITWVDGIALGVENMTQMLENIDYFNRPALNEDQVANIRKTRLKLDEDTLNPALWKKTKI
jgi:spore coat polysaccharide biosynthesis protein SpsF (cytidylyltransferase family)/aryl-alcohol dehydrogenase-like predicted oxidoreductase